ncbi:Asp-tRNA(Asn)/Glu-tRNA(Gln) amidotransferase subunit GatC [Chromatocurvus halotolerans]|uniref:Aspartyl/glutamyl-tRNA(Asn/Gln) amidotransferase subunit C n=1 Tax=Chromatocurvus halotolerans TaxID=1132028 RepID=A0A4R2KPT7_9GAMM|nr:Asp-tRNA(Asn)/Glu-tRNA(Gln) amidotransferase subunit GatC [Chromatocurvus halotolerans]TCO76241.1 aspartyl/glutamyl-tRNA(Asn/Gln) amidotransferase subunit C [Chromatocurvus halotolerans]
MSIGSDELSRIAELARLRVDSDELPALTRRLDDILGMVETLQTVDTEGVEPLSNPLDAHQPLRADVVTEGNRRSEFQSIAPAVENGLYLVPKVIE